MLHDKPGEEYRRDRVIVMVGDDHVNASTVAANHEVVTDRDVQSLAREILDCAIHPRSTRTAETESVDVGGQLPSRRGCPPFGREATHGTTVRDADAPDVDWIRTTLEDRWGHVRIVTRGQAHAASRLPALIAVRGAERCGLLTYRPSDTDAEIVTLDALVPSAGIGSF